MWRGLGCISFVAICFTLGCGAKQVPIEGTVTLDGDPLAGAQVLFDQPDRSSGKSFAGKTDESGHFTLRPVGGDPDADVAGTYRVSLTTVVPDREATEHDPVPPERVPKHYRNGSLEFEVPEGGTDTADFELTKKRKK